MDTEKYDKEAIISTLMNRDNMSQEDAEALVIETQEEINSAIEDSDTSHDALEEIIEDILGLEPDYLMCFLDN